MNSRETSEGQETAGAAPTPALAVQIVYEDKETGLCARRTFEHVVDHFSGEADFEVALWRFDLLQDDTLRQLAARAAAAADIVLIAAHGRERLPEAVSSYVEEWLALKPGVPPALVLSFDASAKNSPVANRILGEWERLTRSAGVELIPHFGPAASPPEALTFDPVQHRSGITTAIQGAGPHPTHDHSYRHWAVNDS
jgi:hypothetical protein